ncbi:hypothetical protein ANO11243_033810 [Dothideomycetidae sp. 11243]|nr:hypothetical protein ANO11243_033810 [fungal sp. No.11243]
MSSLPSFSWSQLRAEVALDWRAAWGAKVLPRCQGQQHDPGRLRASFHPTNQLDSRPHAPTTSWRSGSDPSGAVAATPRHHLCWASRRAITAFALAYVLTLSPLPSWPSPHHPDTSRGGRATARLASSHMLWLVRPSIHLGDVSQLPVAVVISLGPTVVEHTPAQATRAHPPPHLAFRASRRQT